ncbi:MAG TPA: alginate lyase family protein, partial [Candidatus Sulfotelmatobacter sp.]|nr:alginate lyase family protein [Candidatus Sulfotelmatobacter sp.]
FIQRIQPIPFFLRAANALVLLVAVATFWHRQPAIAADSASFNLREIERPRILQKAAKCLQEQPVTVTASHCNRSAGGQHDFYSEGDYWWPDPKNPDGPYVQRDGLSNTNNFVEHRYAMVRLSEIVSTLGSAYLLTGEERYVRHAVKHLKAWFVDEETKMTPHLLYGQAIKGKATGRSIGVIDTIHLAEVARATLLLRASPAFAPRDFEAVQSWFRAYLTWLTTHPYGTEERAASNNHGVCWALQAAAFAQLIGDQPLLASIRHQFKTVFLAKQMATDGSFPAELRRTKPYGYSLFVLDAMAGVAQIASTPEDNLWTFELPDGRGMKKGMQFLFPFIQDKSKWAGQHDVLYWEEWPVRHLSLVFASLTFNEPEYLKVWQRLPSDPQTPEVLRNLPLRHPLLWVAAAQSK